MHTRDRMDRAACRVKTWLDRLELAEDELLGINMVYVHHADDLGKDPRAVMVAAADYRDYCFKNHKIWLAAEQELSSQVIEEEEAGTAPWM